MSISLLRFPLLALIEILKNMAYSDIFNLSVCSKRMHNLVRLVKFKQVAKISYMFNGKVMNIGVEEHSGRRHFVVATSCNEESISDGYNITIGSIKNIFRFGNGSGPTAFYFLHNADSEDIVKRSVITHCFGIFQRHSPIVQLRMLCNQSLSYLPLIEGVKEMYMDGSDINVQYAAISYPDLSCLRIGGIFGDGARFSGIDNLRCDQTGPQANSVLQSFTGTFLYLFNSHISTGNLVEFCRSWQRNELCQNVKFIYIQLGQFTPFLDGNRLSNELQLQLWNPAVRPELFQNIPFMLDVYDCPKGIITHHFRDFQRATDGKWASLCVRVNEFYFIVWD